MTLYDVPAPAKLNLFLHIVGRRPDGYHLLQSVFRFVDLCDTLSFEARSDGLIERAYDLPGVAPEQDLIVRAARALQAACGVAQGARIGLVKRIPQGGGLGGGSSDAATTLIALNRLWGCGLSRRDLMALALPLGADVPVFVFGQPAFAEGVGEDLQAVSLPETAYLLVQPEASVPTAEIFSAPDLTRNSKHVRITDFLALPNFGFGRNDMEAVVFRRYPQIEASVRRLGELGIRVRMSGSGACLFAEYPTLSAASQAQDVLAKFENTATMRGAGKIVSETQPEFQLGFRLIKACAGLNEHPLRSWIAS
ncbi:4-(cytidine 5'-diphospho)-2-C-methyl-D-erythritol kinase [Bordetella holmesii]|uniref:4-(cytidine 5'-diphospho)-2-C-methyl-D-erythritol kinase n=1 Tax=Bordetella holmesii TaxID=35814 RepID=UPI000C7879A8|nr:4-(cytidine 5'-diphospho)-2-C-methyl-D-erythritol kinase [Bordetella holmesii]AUL20446.1 4-(cytidine 5'-diphospho)-2-C-methyl-D-erythritol kinase [Bordetella holmesii]AUL51776.1 4-(cytidine 5'-diphospho)-2-C-methyl-D-erythritol kinase [Bordetella holmesii]